MRVVLNNRHTRASTRYPNFSQMLMKKFAEIVDEIRRAQSDGAPVPGFDPKNGNEEAPFLFVLETPGPQAVQSGMISIDNDDPSARNFGQQLAEAGILQKEVAIWNVVPWFLGSVRPPNADEIRVGEKYLKDIIDAMPRLKCIVLVGGSARQAHVFLSRVTTARILACHHPSARVRNTNPQSFHDNVEIFRLMKSQ